MRLPITCLILASSLLMLSGAVKGERVLHAGEKSSILIEKNIDTSGTMRAVNPLLVSIDIRNSNNTLVTSGFDFRVEGQLSQPSGSHNIIFDCHSQTLPSTQSLSRQWIALRSNSTAYCVPNGELFLLERNTKAELSIKLTLGTSWRLKSGSYRIEPEVRSSSLVSSSSRGLVLAEGEADIKTSKVALHPEVAGPNGTELYVLVQNLESRKASIRVNNSAGDLLYRCLGTLSHGCTWKQLPHTKTRPVTKIYHEGLYAVVNNTTKTIDRPQESNPQAGDEGAASGFDTDTIDRNGSRSATAYETGEKIDLNFSGNTTQKTDLVVNGERVGNLSQDRAVITPLDPGRYELAIQGPKKDVGKSLMVERQTIKSRDKWKSTSFALDAIKSIMSNMRDLLDLLFSYVAGLSP